MERLGLSEKNFPKVIHSGSCAGILTNEWTKLLSLQGRIPVHIGAHDHVCACYGIQQKGKIRICDSMGTAETFLSLTTEKLTYKEAYERGCILGPFPGQKSFWMSNISSAGESVEWVRTRLQKEEISYDEICTYLKKTEAPTGILYLPFLSGMGAPKYQAGVKGAFIGLEKTQGIAELIRAVMEGVSYHEKWILDEGKVGEEELVCVGGAVNNPYWMQIKADVLGKKLISLKNTEVTLFGAVGLMILDQRGETALLKFQSALWKECRIYFPEKEKTLLYEKIYRQYREFIRIYINYGNRREKYENICGCR